ncbi:MAG: glycosyltransferase family A protein [Microbacterium sp.]
MSSASGDESRPDHDQAATTGVTVIVCTRDRAHLLVDALAALRAAVPADAEILVVDSGSTTSATRDAALTANVRYVRSDTPGLSIARNAGLAATDAELIVFTDDDCAVTPDFLAPLIAPFIDPGVAAATGTLRDIGDSSPLSTAAVEVLRRTNQGLDAGHGALMAFRRSALLTAGGFDPLLGAGRHFGGAEDMDVFCRLLHAGHAVARVPASVVTHVYTRNDEDYIALNENYGRGIGAMCAKWLRTDRRAGISLTALVMRRAVVRFARRLRSARSRRGQLAYLRAVVRGLRQARTLSVRDGLFIDSTPPAPVSASADATSAVSEGLPA